MCHGEVDKEKPKPLQYLIEALPKPQSLIDTYASTCIFKEYIIIDFKH